jgi:hypothetical protein
LNRLEAATRFVRDELDQIALAAIVPGTPAWNAIQPVRHAMPLDVLKYWRRLKNRSTRPEPNQAEFDQVRQDFQRSFLAWVPEQTEESMPDGKRLNLGSGWHRLPGFTNVDLHSDADVKADLRTVEFQAESVDEILSTHCIEHLDQAAGRRLLGRCFEWLRPGGTLTIETPDALKCRRLLASRPLEGAKGLRGGRSINKRGWHEWLLAWAAEGADLAVDDPAEWNLPGEPHLYVWHAAELAKAFLAVGFVPVEIQDPLFHGRRTWRDCRVVGVRPEVVDVPPLPRTIGGL